MTNAALSANASGVDPSDPPASLAGDTLRAEHRAFESWLPQPGQTIGPSEIHQLRITLRHLRVVLRLFDDALRKECRPLRRELGWLGRRLGEVRDLDVHADVLRALRQSDPQHTTALERLEARNEAARATARARLSRTFESARFVKLRAALADFVSQDLETASSAAVSSRPIVERISKNIRKSTRRLRKLGAGIDADSPPQALHRVRIRAKRLRYELEFFSDLFPELEPLMRAARRLQNVLGDYNDDCVAAARLRKQANERSRGTLDPAAFEALIASLDAMAAEERGRFDSAWKRFERATSKVHLAA